MSAAALNGRSYEPSIMRPPCQPSSSSVRSSCSWIDCVGTVRIPATPCAIVGRASSDGALSFRAPTGMADTT